MLDSLPLDTLDDDELDLIATFCLDDDDLSRLGAPDRSQAGWVPRALVQRAWLRCACSAGGEVARDVSDRLDLRWSGTVAEVRAGSLQQVLARASTAAAALERREPGLLWALLTDARLDVRLCGRVVGRSWIVQRCAPRRREAEEEVGLPARSARER
jgi:hypothetical protein